MRRVLVAVALAATFGFAPVAGHAAEMVSGLVLATPQPAAKELSPGLAVTYYFAKFDHTREVLEWAKYKDGVEGEPIAVLDYFVGDGDVLTSGQADFVGADIRGYINMPVAGTYTFAMHSNDGVNLEIGGKRVVYDPIVHSDRFSDLIPVEVSEPGWYPLRLIYFEKQVTSTLELFWLKPGQTGQLEHVPADALAHLPGEKPGR